MANPNAGVTTTGLDKAEQLEQLLYAILNPTVTTLSVTAGTAQQDASGLPSNVYVKITGGASGTVTVAIGPDNTTANTIVSAGDATLNQTVDFNLPAGWWFKVTVGGSAAVAASGHRQVTGL
jgi:hypothetical protein